MHYYLFVNFKTYEEGTGEKALSLARLMASFNTGEVDIIPVCQAAGLLLISQSVPLRVFAQHADPVGFGANTGMILPESLKSAGAFGTIINHAENKRDNDFVKKAIGRCHGAGLKVMACAESLERARQIAKFSPDFLAIEPPELIGGDISVSTANPGLICDSVKEIRKINPQIIVITGAGIKSAGDVAKAIELGTSGVFVASGIVCAKDKEYALQTLLSGFPANKQSRSKAEP